MRCTTTPASRPYHRTWKAGLENMWCLRTAHMKNTYQSLEAIQKLRILGASRDFWRTSCRQKSDLMKTAEYSKMAAMQGSSWWFKGRKDMLADMMGEYFGIVGGCRVLDIGCGTGSNIAALARIGKIGRA